MREVRLALVGLGNLGRRFCEILVDKEPSLRERYGLAPRLVAAADSGGAAYDPGGLDPAEVARLKRGGGTVAAYPRVGRRGWDAPSLVAEIEAELLLEASPVNLEDRGEPGLTNVRTALGRGMHVVTPNKGPLVLAYRELHALAAERGVELRFDGTVAGGLPALNLGQRDLRGGVIERVEAVPNLVTGYIIDMLGEGVPWEGARSRAFAEGVLEGDGTWDLEGWDAAAKLAILANAVLGYPASLDDVTRTGITGLDAEDVRAARDRGYRYRLLAQAERDPDGTYALSVAPVPLSEEEHPLGRMGRKQMGVVYASDIYGTITAIIEEPSPVPSAASMLRDLLDIYVGGGGGL